MAQSVLTENIESLPIRSKLIKQIEHHSSSCISINLLTTADEKLSVGMAKMFFCVEYRRKHFCHRREMLLCTTFL
jgi:hypothetical protein